MSFLSVLRGLYRFIRAHRRLKRVVRALLRLDEPFRRLVARAYTAYVLAQCAASGPGVRFAGRGHITHPNRLVLGSDVRIGEGHYFDSRGGLVIGDNTVISRCVTIFTSSHRYEGEALPFDDSYVCKPVLIGRNVWIGMRAVVVPGVSIGDGAVIGAGTVVTRDVPPLAVVGSSSTRIIRFRDVLRYRRLVREEDSC